MLDGIQYLASGLTGFLLGAGLDKFGWPAWTFMIVPFSLIGSLMMIRVWNAKPGNPRVPDPPESLTGAAH